MTDERYDPQADSIASYYDAIAELRKRHLLEHPPMILPENFRLGVHPDDIILALRAATKRFKIQQRSAADYAANKEYRRAHNLYRYRAGQRPSGWQRIKKLRGLAA